MRLLVSGSSGFVGRSLCTLLRSQGYEVIALERKRRSPQSLQWEDPLASFEKFDGVIHLAGEKLSLGRWTQKKKQAIFQSRVDYTSKLVSRLSQVQSPPSVFISASAVGIYGDRGEELLDETSPVGDGFLAQVCKAWEGAAAPLAKRGIRTAQTRFGMVLGAGGGALQTLLPLYRWGLGAIVGSGQQWVSWVALQDLVRSIEWILQHPLNGPINVVSPQAVRQEAFARALGQKVHRPVLWKIPAWMIRLVLQEMGKEVLLASAHAVPQKLLESGFIFQQNLESYLHDI